MEYPHQNGLILSEASTSQEQKHCGRYKFQIIQKRGLSDCNADRSNTPNTSNTPPLTAAPLCLYPDPAALYPRPCGPVTAIPSSGGVFVSGAAGRTSAEPLKRKPSSPDDGIRPRRPPHRRKSYAISSSTSCRSTSSAVCRYTVEKRLCDILLLLNELTGCNCQSRLQCE